MSEWCASGPSEEIEDEPQPEIESGHAGASARREYERRRTRDEARTRKKWGILGGVAVALSAEKPTTKAWETGAVGEERLGRRLDDAASEDLMILHDRLRPGTRMNIDHIAVTAEGVWVIDAKRYHGRPERKVTGGVLRPRAEHLVVGARDCTDLVEAMHGQMRAVGEVVGDHVPITGALCFVNADWPLVGGAFTVRGVEVLWPKKLVDRLRGQSEGPHDVEAIVRRLAEHFPEA